MLSRGSDALQRVARLFKIVSLAHSHTGTRPLGRTALAEVFGCDVRTVQRVLDLLLEAGIPIAYDARRRAYVLPEKGWSIPSASLTAEDALALALAHGILIAPGLPHHEALRATLDKLTASLSPNLADLMRAAGSVVHHGHPARNYSSVPLPDVMKAASLGQTVELDYASRSRGERAWRRVDPYAVEARAGQFWELHGWCHRNGAVRTFALDQIFGVRLTGEAIARHEAEWAAFTGTEGVVGGMRGGPSVAVDVTFLPDVAAYARDRHWPEGLSLTMGEDGTARITGVAQGADGLVAELLRWRRHCRVNGGPELRAAMAEEVRAMAALYE